MKNILKKEVGNAFQSFLWPDKSEDIPDNKDIKLVILKPYEKEDVPQKWLEKRGRTFRTYKNTMIFASSDPGGFGALKEEVKTYLALKEIEEDIRKGKEGGLSDRAKEVAQRIKRIRDDFSYNCRRTYNVLVVGKEKISLGQPTVGRESLSNWYKIQLETREKLVANLHYRYLVNKFMTGKDELETKVIFDQFYKEPLLVMPESIEVVKRSIRQGIAEGAFGMGYIDKEQIDVSSLKFESNIPTTAISFDEGEVLLSKEKVTEAFTRAKEEKERLKRETGEEETTIRSDVISEPSGVLEEVKKDEDSKPKKGPKRYNKISLRIEDIPSSKIADLNRGVLLPLSREVGGFNFNMEINIEAEDGVSETTLKNKIKETIYQIGAKVTKEEVE
jgi:hypothetical protein